MNARSADDPVRPDHLAALLFGTQAPADHVVMARSAGGDTTAGELRRRAQTIADALTAAGGGPGDRVAVVAPSDVNALAALFGCWRVDAVVVPINPRLTDTEIARTLTLTAVTMSIMADADLAAHRSAFADRRVIVIDGPKGAAPARVAPDDPPESNPTGDDPSGDDADVALILTTSGTTGVPKPVQLRHHSILEGIDTVLDKLTGGRPPDPDRPRPPNIIPVPLALWAGLYNVLFAWRSGAAVILLDPFTTTGFVAIVAEHGVKSSVLAPPMIAMLTDDPTITDLGTLKIVRSITAPLSPLQAHRFHDRFGIAVLNSYGQTELGGEVIGWNAADSRTFGATKLGAVGRPHAGIELRVIDDGRLVETGGEGELCIRSPYMMAGYLDRDLDDRLTPDGFLRTGDIGSIDEEGFVWLSGRVSDLIIRGGLKVFPGEVEEVLRLHPKVADVAVVGVPDDRLGEVPWAFVVASGPIGTDSLVAVAREHLAPYKVPVRFEFLDALPRNDVGKVLGRDLAARASKGVTP